MGDENQVPQGPKPDWIASSISGQIKNPSQLMSLGVKATDFSFEENPDVYWKTPAIQKHFNNDKNSFINFYASQKEAYNQTKKSDYELDFNIDVATDKWSRKPLIGFSTKSQVDDPFGRNHFGDYYSPKKFSEREQAIKTGVKVGDDYVPLSQYKGEVRLAKDESGMYKRDSRNRTYWEPVKPGEEFRSFDESYDSFAHNMGIYGLNPSYLSEGFYTVVKSVPNFINSTSNSLLELPRVLGADVSGIQNQFKQNLMPSSDRTKETFLNPVHLAELGLDSVMQLFSMGAVGKVAGALSNSSKVASAAGRIYMTGMAAGPMAQISRENNLSAAETAVLYGLNAAAVYKLSGLSDMVVRGIRPLELEKIIAPKLAQDYGVTIAKKGFTESAMKSFQNRVTRTFEGAILSLSSKPYVKSSFLEGLEEVGEQTVDSGIRGLHNIVSELIPLQGRFQWDLGREVEALFQAGAGGAFGGAIAHPILKKMGDYDRELVDSFETAVAFNDEGFVHKMINDWEKSGRLSKDGKQGEENTRNATALREVLNTMTTIRDRAGIADAIKNNQKKAGIFADILKSSSIGRDKIILQNELATLENQLDNASKADNKELIETLTKQVEAKKAEISQFNSGSQVDRYITEGLYNVESNPNLKSTIVDSSDLGIEALPKFALLNNDHFNGKLFTLMNIDSRNNRDRLKAEVSKRNEELIQNSAKVNLDNFEEMDITPDAKQRLLDEANALRNKAVEDYKNSGLDSVINEVFADDEDFDASLIYTTSPENSFRFSQEILKRITEPYKNEEWYSRLAPLFDSENLINKINQKKAYKTAPDIEGDSHIYYDFENGKSTVPLEAKLNEILRSAGMVPGMPAEESDRLSKMFISPEPKRIIQVIDDRISQVLGNYALKNKKGYSEIISAEVSDVKNTLLTLAALKGQFSQLKTLSDENEKNTDVRILQVYIKSLEKQFNVLQNFVKLIETDIPKVGEIFSEHEVEMQEALDKQDYVAYRRESLQVDKKMFDLVRSQRATILDKLQKSFKGDTELLSDEGILAKNTYDYARAVLSNDPTKFVQASREVVVELKSDVKTPTREHLFVAEMALRNAFAGNYNFRIKNSDRSLYHLSYTSSINGGPGTGKTVTEIPLIAAMVNKMTGGNVIVTAYKDSSGKKIQKVRSDVEKFFKGKPDFIQHSDSSLIDILKSDEIKNVSAIIFDEAALMSATQLDQINTELLRVNQSRPNNPVHIFYTYDESQNGYRDKNSRTTYSITSPVISVPSTPRLTFSFRSVNNPLKALENTLRNSQFANTLPSDIVLNYDKDFNGVRFVNSKEELEKLVVDLATKLKSEKNLSSMVYINANIENTAVPSASALSVHVTTSVESQGDEWDYVVVDTSDGEIFGSSIRQKEVYTAVTRAKKGVIVYASPSMPVGSVEGVVKEFKPITPPEISQQAVLEEIDNILQNQKVDSSFNPSDTIKTPPQAVRPTGESAKTTETPVVSQEKADDLEASDYRRIMNAMTNTQNRVLLNTFYDVPGELDVKKSILFNKNVQENSSYQVTVAKIGSPGYVADARIDSSAYNGKYALFLEAITPDNKRAVLGVIYAAGGQKIETTLRNLNIIKQDETNDIAAVYPVSNNILRGAQFFHPFVQNESFSNSTSPDGSKQAQPVNKKTFSNILSDTKLKGIDVSPILVATSDIIGDNGKVLVIKGEPFVALSYKHSKRQLDNNEFDVLGDEIKLLTLNRESFTLDEIVNLLSPFYKRNQHGYYDADSNEFKNLYYSFWQSPTSKGKRTYEEIFNNVKKELAKKDPQVDTFLKKMDIERKPHEITLANGKKTKVEGGYPVSFLLSDYIAMSLEKDPKKLLRMDAEPKRKLLMAMMEDKAFSRGLRFSPYLSKGSSGLEQTLYGQSVSYEQSFLDKAISANYVNVDLPKIQIPIESILSEISSQVKEVSPVETKQNTPIESTPVETVGRTEQQPLQQSVQGIPNSSNPISMVEFTRREFPNQPALARKAISKFKKDVVASHLVLTVPEGGTPKILDANQAMANLKKIYLSNGNLISQNTNTESRIQYALGSNFNGLLAQYFPAIKYNSLKDKYYYGNDLTKSNSFVEKEMENLLGDGINSIVKTYLYNIKLPGGNYITSKNISNLLKLIKSSTNSKGQAIRTLDEVSEILGNSSLPEAKAVYKTFFSKLPEETTVTGSQTKNLTYSTRLIETPSGQNLTNAILMFLNTGQIYSPGFININITTDDTGMGYEDRVSKLPISGFNPQYIKTQFLDKFERILRTGKISVSNGDVNLNGQLYTAEKKVTPENALRMLKAMGFEGFTSDMMQEAILFDPTVPGQIQDYFLGSVKNYNKKQSMTPTLGVVMDKVIERFISAKGLGNDFSFKDGMGKRQYGLRDSAPIFQMSHAISNAQNSPLLQTNLLVNGESNYGISSKQPFTHLGFKINKNGFEYTKSVSQLTVPELLDLYLIEGYVSQIEAGRNEATFPITVYADSSQEISPIFYSKNLLQPAEKTIGDLFDSRTKYYIGLEFKILNDYKQLGTSAKSLDQLNTILGKLTEEQINEVVKQPNIISGVHYDEKSVKGPFRIKQELINDVNTYVNPANKQIFIEGILADAQQVVEYSKIRRGSSTSLYDQIKKVSSKATPEEFIKTFYANWLLFTGEFQHLMNGPKYQYKESGQKAFIDMVKRSKSLVSPESYFVLRNDSWASDVQRFREQNPGKPLPYSLMYEGKKLSRIANVMRFEDPIHEVLKLSNGSIVKQKWTDGVTLASPLTRIKQNHSTALDAGPFAGPVMKNITHSNDFESGTKSFVKNAEFEITPFILQNGNEFVITKFIQMTSVDFPSTIEVNNQPVSNAYQLLIALGMNPDFSNAIEMTPVFEQAMDIMVENGFQDYIVDEIIFQSSEKTGQRGVNKLSDPNPSISAIDITMKGIQQDGSKDPSKGMEVNVLTQLVNALAINWVNSPVLKKFYETLSDITKSYVQDLAKMGVAERVRYFTEIMREDLLGTDGSNYRTDAAAANRLSINDRTIAPKYTQTIATNIKNAAVAFGIQGGNFVIHPALMDVYEVEELGQTFTAESTTSLLGPETKINIYAGTGENAELSNFANRPFKYDDADDYIGFAGIAMHYQRVTGKSIVFNTVEGYFQANKLLDSNEYWNTEKEEQTLTPKGVALIEQFAKATGIEAKALGRTIKELNKKDWDNLSSTIMKDGLYFSFKQNPNALAKLLATGNATLTHTQDKGKWGTEFPRLLMEVRNELKGELAQPSVSATTIPTTGKIRIVLKSQLGQFDPNTHRITQRRLKWQDPVRLSDGVSLSQLYAEGVDQQLINDSLKNDEWSKGFAEILLPAEMLEDFELDDIISNNIPIDEIDEKYFLKKLLTPDEFNSKIISETKKKRAKLMYESFRVRLEGVMARIPTSGKHSAVATVIVGFFQGSMNSVMVPSELFTVQGADQDYDKGSYITYQSIKEYTMVDPNVRGGREIKTYNPDNPNYSHLVVKNVRPTGLIPFDSNLNDIKSVKNFSKDDFKAIQKIAQKNELVKAINSVLSDSKSIIELNTTSDDVMKELRDMRDIILEGASEEQKLKFDHLMSLLKIHELNQAGGKNLVGIFANGAKAYNVLYLSARMNEIKNGQPFSQEVDKIWENFAALISASVDNANEGVLGPLVFDQITAPYISYLVSTGMSIPEVADFINSRKSFFDAIRKSKQYNSIEAFNINGYSPKLKKLNLHKIEWDVLTQSLTNRDVPITMEDISAHILTLENYINMSYGQAGLKNEAFDFERFFSNDRSYAQRHIGFYNSLIGTGNHANNILEIFDNAPHMRSYQEAIAQEHNMFKDIKAYNSIYAVNSVKLRNKSLLTESKNKASAKYRYNPENFIKDYNTVHGMYVHAYLNSRDFSLITAANIDSYEGRIQFINEVNNSLLNLKSKYPDNEFIKDLTLETNDFTKESKIRMYDFYDMNDDLRALYMEEFQKLDPIDRKRLFIYNLIVTRDRNSKGSFTSIVSIDDKADYINFLDYELNIPDESIAQVINQETTADDSNSKLNNLAIPYSNFNFEKNQPKITGKLRFITRSKDPVDIEYVNYINQPIIGVSAANLVMVDNKPVIRIDRKVIETNFRLKKWTYPIRLDDGTYSTGLPYSSFSTVDEYERFNIEYEYLAFKNKEMPVNERIQKALMNVGKNKFVPYTTNKETENNMARCSIKEYDEYTGTYRNVADILRNPY